MSGLESVLSLEGGIGDEAMQFHDALHLPSLNIAKLCCSSRVAVDVNCFRKGCIRGNLLVKLVDGSVLRRDARLIESTAALLDIHDRDKELVQSRYRFEDVTDLMIDAYAL